VAVPVPHDHQGVESEPPAALPDVGNPIDAVLNDDLSQVEF
jgi:hypothetical protein